jgi:hypothetical protein
MRSFSCVGRRVPTTKSCQNGCDAISTDKVSVCHILVDCTRLTRGSDTNQTRNFMMLKFTSAVFIVAGTVALAGCESSKSNGDPGARPLPPGASCQSIRADLNKMDSQGAQSTVEASTQGRKLSPQQQAVVDRYNGLLNQYLGARCHT